MPLLEIDILKFFEISTVFSTSPSLSLERRGTEQEEKRVLLVCDDNKKKTKYSGDLEKIISDLEALLKVKIKVISQNEKPSAVEFSLKQIVEEVEKNNIKLDFVPIEKDLQSIKYSPISIYPFISRDVACWVGADFDFESFKQKILDLKLENFVKTYMFDIFEKEGRMSIAFRIIFQSKEKTLTDVEVEVEMQKVYTLLKENNFEIR